MNNKKIVKAFFSCAMSAVIACGAVSVAWAQMTEQKQDEDAARLSAQLRRAPFQFNARSAVYAGFDNNVYLDSSRKGDMFEEFLFSSSAAKMLNPFIRGKLSYFVDYLNYNEFRDASSLYNRFAASIEKMCGAGSIGTEASLAYLYYPNYDLGNALFYKGELYVKHPYWFLKKAEGKAFAHFGIKDYQNAQALNDDLGRYLDNERLDKRYGFGYEIAGFMSKKTYLIFNLMAEKNDSNAQYVDYYDYILYRTFLEFDYRIIKRWYLLTALGMERRYYQSRTVTLRDYKQHDNLYTANIGLLYRLTRDKSVTLNYGYRQNQSNEPLEEYSESMVKAGIEFRF